MFRLGTSQGVHTIKIKPRGIRPDSWHHVAVVGDAGVSSLQLYLDGTLQETVSMEGRPRSSGAPLVFGQAEDGTQSFDGQLDEIRISRHVVPSSKTGPNSELGHQRSFGPARVIFGDSFRTYGTTDDLFAFGTGRRNSWKRTESSESESITLVNSTFRSAPHAVLLEQVNAAACLRHEATLYYNLPIQHMRGEAIVAMSGWLSFSGQENARFYVQQQMWPGRTTEHFGVSNRLLASGIAYWGDSKTWKVEASNGRDHGFTNESFTQPIDYRGGLDSWYYFRLVVDYGRQEYQSLQLDEDVWDLSGIPLVFVDGYGAKNGDADLLPTIDANIRMFELHDAPPRPWTTRYAVDDMELRVVEPEE